MAKNTVSELERFAFEVDAEESEGLSNEDFSEVQRTPIAMEQAFVLAPESEEQYWLMVEYDAPVELVQSALQFLVEGKGKYAELLKRVPELRLDRDALVAYLKYKAADKNGSAGIIGKATNAQRNRTKAIVEISETNSAMYQGRDSYGVEL